MSWGTCFTRSATGRVRVYSVRDGAGASEEGYGQGGGSEREVQTSGAAAATGRRHAEAEAAAAGVGHALADVARAARAAGHTLAELRHVEDVHLIFFGQSPPSSGLSSSGS